MVSEATSGLNATWMFFALPVSAFSSVNTRAGLSPYESDAIAKKCSWDIGGFGEQEDQT